MSILSLIMMWSLLINMGLRVMLEFGLETLRWFGVIIVAAHTPLTLTSTSVFCNCPALYILSL